MGPPNPDTGACKCLDVKLRAMAKALRSWRTASVGAVTFQLVIARVVVHELDITQESCALSPGELQWHCELKGRILGLASHERTMARQRARCRHLRDGDACTKYFHLQACHRRRKNYMLALTHDGVTFSECEAKAGAVFTYYNAILGTPFAHSRCINFSSIGLPTIDLQHLILPFLFEEITAAVRATPSDWVPGPDGFCAAFFKVTWDIVGPDVVPRSRRFGSWISEASTASTRR